MSEDRDRDAPSLEPPSLFGRKRRKAPPPAAEPVDPVGAGRRGRPGRCPRRAARRHARCRPAEPRRPARHDPPEPIRSDSPTRRRTAAGGPAPTASRAAPRALADRPSGRGPDRPARRRAHRRRHRRLAASLHGGQGTSSCGGRASSCCWRSSSSRCWSAPPCCGSRRCRSRAAPASWRSGCSAWSRCCSWSGRVFAVVDDHRHPAGVGRRRSCCRTGSRRRTSTRPDRRD